jgi:PKD repeat protein
MRIQSDPAHPLPGFFMMFRKLLFTLGALFAGNAFAQSSFSIYFNGESPTANCHVDGVSNAQLSTSGSGNLVATATTPLAFSSACGISGNAQQLTFGPAQPLTGPASTLAAGSNVVGNFSVLPLNAASCTATIGTSSGSGTVTPTSLNVCGFTGKPSCTATTPIAFSASFTNTGTGASAYLATVTCQAASGASPASLASQATVNQSGNSGGTPAANFTFTTSGLTANFNDTSTDPGGTINAWSWNFGETGSGSNTSTAQNPSHTYAAAGTYTVSLTVTDSVSSAQNTKTQQVTVTTGTGNCLTYGSATSGISNYTRWTGNQTGNYFGGGPHTVDVTSFDSVFGVNGVGNQTTWPGNTSLTADFNMPTNKYMSLKFTVPAGFMETVVSGGYGLNTTDYTAQASMTISDGAAPCGDFSNPATNPTSKVVNGCWKNLMTSSGTLAWYGPSGTKCLLQDNHTYYLNIINADISNADPAGAANLTSSKTAGCGSTCADPIRNKPILYQ